MGKREIYFGVVLLSLSALFFGLTFQFPRQTLAMSPRLFPRAISIGLFFLAAVLVFQGCRGRAKGQEERRDQTAFPWIRFVVLTLMAFLYTQVLAVASYVLTTPFLIAGLMIAFNEKRWTRIVTVSLLTTVVLYILFRMVFRVPLPRFELF
ncbi:MAG: tripartite tricarboxylate transporter TctB family protein [Pseudomonadota bacterium]